MIISTTAGGVGINLHSANRVVILDPCWNPTLDMQAIHRAFRLGQEKEVFVYRLLADGTMEEKVHQRQIQKEGMAHLITTDEHITRLFTDNEVKQLYIFNQSNSSCDTAHCQVIHPKYKNTLHKLKKMVLILG